TTDPRSWPYRTATCTPTESCICPMVRQMPDHTVGTREEWLGARTALLERGKEPTRPRGGLAREREAVPRGAIVKEYSFAAAGGTKTLAELFDGRPQLLVYHIMFGPEYAAACPVCSSSADGFDAWVPHLAARDVTFAAISRAPLDKLLGYRERMGWR